MIGKRTGYGKVAMPPHNLPFMMIGASLLWVGWFGFNVGSGLEANGFAGTGVRQHHARHRGRRAGLDVRWSGSSRARRRCWAPLRAPSRASSRSRRPAAGSARWARSSWACIAGIVCLLAVTKLKSWLGYDDSLDVFGVHCVGGILGALLTGVFNDPALGGYGVYDYVTDTIGYAGTGKAVMSQLWGVGITLVWSGVVALIAFKLVDWTIGLRVTEDVEREGLDTTLHGERAYD